MVEGVGPRLTQQLLERFGDEQRYSGRATTRYGACRGSVRRRRGDRRGPANSTSRPNKDLSEVRRFAGSARRRRLSGELGGDPRPAAAVVREGGASNRATAARWRSSARGTPRNTAPKVAAELAGGLARAGVTVVSGLARGIDAAAHRGASTAADGRSPCSAAAWRSIYPPEHAELADEVCRARRRRQRVAALTDPVAGTFPAAQPDHQRHVTGRDRRRSGRPRSGALITGAHADRARPRRLRRARPRSTAACRTAATT